jgi:hypothetical protein
MVQGRSSPLSPIADNVVGSIRRRSEGEQWSTSLDQQAGLDEQRVLTS